MKNENNNRDAGLQFQGKRIKELRERANLTPDELAGRMSKYDAAVTRQTIGNWERNAVGEIKASNLDALRQALNCTTDYILGKSNSPNKTKEEEWREKEEIAAKHWPAFEKGMKRVFPKRLSMVLLELIGLKIEPLDEDGDKYVLNLENEYAIMTTDEIMDFGHMVIEQVEKTVFDIIRIKGGYFGTSAPRSPRMDKKAERMNEEIKKWTINNK